MAPVTCDKCGKEFKNDFSLKIHAGRMHGEGKARTATRATMAGGAKALVCTICGRRFGMPAHLARHASVAHKTGPKAVRTVWTGRRPGRKASVSATPASPEVQSLSIDQLIALKNEIDSRLADIARKMRAAKVQL